MNPYTIGISVEPERGCGYRRAGKDGLGIYLMGDAPTEPCERLPFPLVVCPACGNGIKQTRGFTWIKPLPLFIGLPFCKPALSHDHDKCPVCSPPDTRQGLLWVGEAFYKTPRDFVQEAAVMGISRRINAIPREFKLGETWVYLAHAKAVLPEFNLFDDDPEHPQPGVFMVFKPKRVDIVVNTADSNELPDKARRLYDRIEKESPGEMGVRFVKVESYDSY